MHYVIAMPAWSHLAPLRRLKALHIWLREPAQRLRGAGAETLKSGAIAANPQRMGPLTLGARREALEVVLGVQAESTVTAEQLGRPAVDLINVEEEARIRELIDAGQWPDGWRGDEPNAAVWLDSVYQDGSVQPLLFRELVGV